MNTSGKQLKNNYAVRRLLSNATALGANVRYFQDALANGFLVNLVDGCIYRVVGDDVRPCNSVETSKKLNGYLYVELAVWMDDVLQYINYAQHSIIGMLAYTSVYDSFVYKDITPVINHKDNCPWHNAPSNLEWVTHADNVLHGKVVASVHDFAPSIHTMLGHTLAQYERNNNTLRVFNTLAYGISVADINKYERLITSVYRRSNGSRFTSIKEFWGLDKKDSSISVYHLCHFLTWLTNGCELRDCDKRRLASVGYLVI